MAISPGSEDERMLLAKWIKMGHELVISSFPLGESVLDPNVKRLDDVAQKVEAYVEFDHEVAQKLPHLKGKIRYALETYYRDTWGPFLPSDQEIQQYYG